MPDDDLIVEAVEAPDDLRSALNSAFDAQNTSETPVEQAEPRSDGPVRAPDGRFARAETPDPAPVSEPGESAEPVATTATEPKSTAEPPPLWPEADKATFRALPAEAQAILARREGEMTADYTRKTTEIAAFRRDFEPVQQMLAPHMDRIRQAGFTPATLIENWHRAEVALGNPATAPSMVRDLVRAYKIDPMVLVRELGVQIPQASGEPPPPDGQTPIQLPPQLTSELETLKRDQATFRSLWNSSNSSSFASKPIV